MDIQNIALKATAIGSLPHTDKDSAIKLIFETFEIPFWPQLAKINKFEDMIAQYTQNMCSVEYDDENEKFIFNEENETFYEQLEEFYIDYEEITENGNDEFLEKYAITEPFSCAIPSFLDNLKVMKPDFAKGHVTGPFTWGVALTDQNNKCAFYDETLKDIVVKTTVLKALWQIKQIKKVSQNTTPIIFIDEPAMSQAGTSTFVTVKKSDIICSLKQIATEIKKNGALSAIHCCGKCDWDMVLDSGVNILNLDAYTYSKSLSLYSNKVEEFIKKSGIIAWGIVPTLDVDALSKINIDILENKFDEAIKYLTDKGIDKKLILTHSIFTPSCGAGSLSVELAHKAMELTREFSEKIKQKYLEI